MTADELFNIRLDAVSDFSHVEKFLFIIAQSLVRIWKRMVDSVGDAWKYGAIIFYRTVADGDDIIVKISFFFKQVKCAFGFYPSDIDILLFHSLNHYRVYFSTGLKAGAVAFKAASAKFFQIGICNLASSGILNTYKKNFNP